MKSYDAPRVSIVIASYNHARFIEEAIQSILEQDYPCFEIVITDDCSTDNSAEVIQKFRDPRIKLKIFMKNCGPSIAMNDAILRSEGEFVANLGSDDFFLPGKLKRQVEFLDENPRVSAVFGLPKLINEDGAALNTGLQEFSLPFFHETPTRYEWLRHFFYVGNCLCHPSVLIRRSVHDRLGLYNSKLRALADFDMWVRICLHGEIHVIKEELVGRRVLNNDQNLSALRRDNIIQYNFEETRILRHFRDISENDFKLIFAKDLNGQDVTTVGARNFILAQLALRINTEFANFFALSTIFDIENLHDEKCQEFIGLSSTHDLFGIFKRDEVEIELHRIIEEHREVIKEIENIRGVNNSTAEMLELARSRLTSAANERSKAVGEFKGIWWRSLLRYPFNKQRRTTFAQDKFMSLFPSLDDK